MVVGPKILYRTKRKRKRREYPRRKKCGYSVCSDDFVCPVEKWSHFLMGILHHSTVIFSGRGVHSVKLTACTCRWAIPKGNSSSNHWFSGASLYHLKNPTGWALLGLGSGSKGTKWVFPKIGVSQNGWFISWKTYEQMDDLGVPLFLETPTCSTNTAGFWGQICDEMGYRGRTHDVYLSECDLASREARWS